MFPMHREPIKTSIEIYWERAAFPSDKEIGLYTTMNLRGFSRKERTCEKEPDLWVRDAAGELRSWRWLGTLCRQYKANGFYIRPEYSIDHKDQS